MLFQRDYWAMNDADLENRGGDLSAGLRSAICDLPPFDEKSSSEGWNYHRCHTTLNSGYIG